MTEAEFLETVRQEASLDSTDTARNATEATLETFGERITDGEAADLAQQLPDRFAETLTNASPSEAEPFSLETFTDRVSERARIDESDVDEFSRAVVTALAKEAGPELDVAREQLPTEFDLIFEPGGPVTEREFLESVQQRASLDSTEMARDATVETLRTLGERLSQGEASDLALYLPNSFAEAITESDDESATNYSFDEFVQRLSQRASVPKDVATVHARAVCSTLADAASGRELEAAKKQLPDPFGRVFDPPDE